MVHGHCPRKPRKGPSWEWWYLGEAFAGHRASCVEKCSDATYPFVRRIDSRISEPAWNSWGTCPNAAIISECPPEYYVHILREAKYSVVAGVTNHGSSSRSTLVVRPTSSLSRWPSSVHWLAVRWGQLKAGARPPARALARLDPSALHVAGAWKTEHCRRMWRGHARVQSECFHTRLSFAERGARPLIAPQVHSPSGRENLIISMQNVCCCQAPVTGTLYWKSSLGGESFPC